MTTPSPRRWSAYINPITGKGSVTLDATGTNEPLTTKPIEARDACLIGAAPDLLATLQEALVEVEGFTRRTGTPQFVTWIRNAKAAIAKAEGRSG